MRTTQPALWLALALLSGCRTTRTERPYRAPAHAATLVPARAWELRDADELLGFVVLFRALDEPQSELYCVRNAWHQELGLVDRLGRAWRYRPHANEPEWIGTGTVQDGARAILGKRGARLCATPLERAGGDLGDARKPFVEGSFGAASGGTSGAPARPSSDALGGRGEAAGIASIAAPRDLERGVVTVRPRGRRSDSPQRESQP